MANFLNCATVWWSVTTVSGEHSTHPLKFAFVHFRKISFFFDFLPVFVNCSSVISPSFIAWRKFDWKLPRWWRLNRVEKTSQKLPRNTSISFSFAAALFIHHCAWRRRRSIAKTPHHLSHFQSWEKIHFKNSRFVISSLSFSFVKEKIISKLLVMCCNACNHSFQFCSHRNAHGSHRNAHGWFHFQFHSICFNLFQFHLGES